MLEKVREWAEKTGTGYAWHTGSVPQQHRRKEIRAFHDDPDCRLFLSTDSGGVGLNLQVASVVVHCDLPWNPAKLEQRIARAWRKHQKRPVTVVNLIAENTIEHSMLETLANKTNLSEGVLDGSEESLKNARLKSGTEATLARLNQMLGKVTTAKTAPKPPPTDPATSPASIPQNPPSPRSKSNASPTSVPSPPKNKKSPTSSPKPTFQTKQFHTNKPQRKPSPKRTTSKQENFLKVDNIPIRQ